MAIKNKEHEEETLETKTKELNTKLDEISNKLSITQDKFKSLSDLTEIEKLDGDDILDAYADRIEELHKYKNDNLTSLSKEMREKIDTLISDVEFKKIRKLAYLNSSAKGKTRHSADQKGAGTAENFKSKALYYPFKDKVNGDLEVTVRQLDTPDLYAFIANNFKSFFKDDQSMSPEKYRDENGKVDFEKVIKFLKSFKDKQTAVDWVNANVNPKYIARDILELEDAMFYIQ